MGWNTKEGKKMRRMDQPVRCVVVAFSLQVQWIRYRQDLMDYCAALGI
jgi:hypothetical protein